MAKALNGFITDGKLVRWASSRLAGTLGGHHHMLVVDIIMDGKSTR